MCSQAIQYQKRRSIIESENSGVVQYKGGIWGGESGHGRRWGKIRKTVDDGVGIVKT